MDDHKALVTARFGATGDDYVRSATHAAGDDLARLVEWAEGGADKTALDVATCGGHVALALAPLYGRVVASDLTPSMLAAAERFIGARGLTNVEFQQADAEALPFPDTTFDAVTCRIAPHHFQDIQRFAQEAARVLVSGGILLLEDSVAPEEPGSADLLNRVERLRDPSHARTLSESEWCELLSTAGLRVEAVDRFTKTHHIPSWLDRQRTPEARRVEVIRAFRGAGAVERAVLDIQADELGNPTTYTDTKVLLKARK